MKKLKIMLILLFVFFYTKGQTDVYVLESIAPDSYFLELQKNRFQVYYFKKKDFPGAMSINVLVMEGTSKKKGNIYELYDAQSTKKYRIKYINNEKFLNIDLPIFLKDTLYSSTIRDENYLIIGKWKNRKKDGLWRYRPNKSGEPRRVKTYKDGELIKTVTYKSVYNWRSLRRGYYKK